MKTKYCGILAATFALIISGCASPKTSTRPPYTIAHEMLDAECAASGVARSKNTQMRHRLDSIIDEAVRRVTALNADETSEEGIKQIFSTVDQVLVDYHYNIFIHTKTFSDSLLPGIPPKTEGVIVLTEAMKEHRLKYPYAVYFRFDCDTGSMLHLGVYDRLKKPVVMVETPRHNFLRWRIGPNRHVNWDVNDSRSYTDNSHRNGDPLTVGPFDRDTEIRGHYLQDMPYGETKAYHLAMVASLWKKSGKFEKAIEAYKKSIADRGYVAMTHNNLAWLIATEPTLQRKELHDLALIEAKEAVRLDPKNGGIIDTLAAVHAARHEFDQAIAVEKGGRNDSERIKAYETGKTPVEMKWRLEPEE